MKTIDFGLFWDIQVPKILVGVRLFKYCIIDLSVVIRIRCEVIEHVLVR